MQTDTSQSYEELWKNEKKALEHERNALKQKAKGLARMKTERNTQKNFNELDWMSSVEKWEHLAQAWKYEAERWKRLRIAWRNTDADDVGPALFLRNQVFHVDSTT